MLLPGAELLVAATWFGAVAAGIAISRIVARRESADIALDSEHDDEVFRGFNLTEAYAAERVSGSLEATGGDFRRWRR